MISSWTLLLGLALCFGSALSEDEPVAAPCSEGTTCTNQRKCLHPQKELKDGNQVLTTCDLGVGENGVCCITGAQAGTKSREKCVEYGRSFGEDGCVHREARLIVNGTNAKPKEFPHMVLIGRLKRGESGVSWDCGGSLIAEQYVLSAAHCTESGDLKAKCVRLGEYNVKSQEDDDANMAKVRDMDIAEWYDHPGYGGLGVNDITIYKMVEPVSFTDFVRPICLNSQTDFTYTEAIATGWGVTENGVTSDILRKVDLPIVECTSYPTKYEIICAEKLEEMKDTCSGDSGGPLQVRMEDPQCMYLELGVTSFGPTDCGNRLPGGYSSVAHYLPWIESIVWP